MPARGALKNIIGILDMAHHARINRALMADNGEIMALSQISKRDNEVSSAARTCEVARCRLHKNNSNIVDRGGDNLVVIFSLRGEKAEARA